LTLKYSNNNISDNIFTKNHFSIDLFGNINGVAENQIMNQNIGNKLNGMKNTMINNTITNSRSYGMYLGNWFENNIDRAKRDKISYCIFIDGILHKNNNFLKLKFLIIFLVCLLKIHLFHYLKMFTL